MFANDPIASISPTRPVHRYSDTPKIAKSVAPSTISSLAGRCLCITAWNIAKPFMNIIHLHKKTNISSTLFLSSIDAVKIKTAIYNMWFLIPATLSYILENASTEMSITKKNITKHSKNTAPARLFFLTLTGETAAQYTVRTTRKRSNIIVPARTGPMLIKFVRNPLNTIRTITVFNNM